jgi:hypothetical protein
MKERPILFSGPMVRAILEGRKTQTRRVPSRTNSVNSEGKGFSRGIWEGLRWNLARPHLHGAGLIVPFGRSSAKLLAPPVGEVLVLPRLALGDRLWVREKWQCAPVGRAAPRDGANAIPQALPDGWTVLYSASGDVCTKTVGWRHSIHMPRWASRITLEITGVRVERLQDISRQDAKAEGLWPSPHNGLEMVEGRPYGNAQLAFQALWQSINGPGSWEANPWVWVIEFRRLTR